MGHNPSVARADAEDCDRGVGRSVDRIVKVLHDLPFAGQVDLLPDTDDADLRDVLADTADWLESYLTVTRNHYGEYARVAQAHAELLDQRDAIRTFLGTSEIGA